MTRGFYTIMVAQFLSSLADNALLIAAIALLAMGVWVIRSLKKSAGFIMYPMAFMLVTTIVALVQMIAANLNNYIVSGISTVLLVLTVLLLKEAYAALKAAKAE